MKPFSRTLPLAASALLAAALAGCAAVPPAAEHSHTASAAMDMQAHCEKHKKMMSGKPTAERQAMMQEHMKSMPPEMHQRMQAMHEQCK